MLFLLAQATILVVPFAVKDGSTSAGIAVSESIADVVVQANRDNFLTIKQLDAVLRRRDLNLEDPALPGMAQELAKALGATDVITGAIDGASIDATRVSVV